MAGSPVRCPFCHEEVRREQEAWVACAGCMARHHAACWDEGGRCAACAGDERLAPERAGPARPRLVRVHAESGAEAPWSRALGLPSRIVLEETFEGEASLADQPWFERAVRRRLGLKGRLELAPQGFVWRAPDCRQVSVSLTSSAGRTRLEIKEELSGPAWGTLWGLGGGVGGGMLYPVVSGLLRAIGLGGPVAGWVIAVLWMALVLGTVRWLLGRRAARIQPQLERLRDDLVAGLERGAWVPPPAPRPRPHSAK